MIRFILRLVRWLTGSIKPAVSDPINVEQPTLVEHHKPTEPAVTVSCVTRQKHQVDNTQAHYYLGDLLERLDEYFDDLKFLRKNDPEMGAVFERYGCSILSNKQLLSVGMEPFFFKNLPAQGCVYFGRQETENDNDNDVYPISFMYFTKHKQPVNVQTTNGVIYVIGGVYRFKFRHVFEWYVSVFPNGTIKVLKKAEPRKYKMGYRDNGAIIERMEWNYPEYIQELARNHNKTENLNLSLDEYATWMFAMMVNAVSRSEMDMNVRVRKQNRVATFAINMLRTPYFFSDRDKTVNENGRTKRILHIVRPHRRMNGKIVKAHWRGERRFTWNGYDVSIGMPGLHYSSLITDWTATAYDEIDAKRLGINDGIEYSKVAEMIDNRVTAPLKNNLITRRAPPRFATQRNASQQT